MTRPPLIFRLMLCSLFLPIIILTCIGGCIMLFYAPEEVRTSQSTTFGVPDVWIPYAFMSLPFVLWLWMLWSGNWRRPVLTAALIFCTCFLLAVLIGDTHTPPDKRMIHLSGIEGTDVYCNGVHLGQLPLEIRVDELTAKVPEWNTPPEQRWYSDSELDYRLCTWIPWDDFRQERFEASKELATSGGSNRSSSDMHRANKTRRQALLKHDAGCRYWWSYRFGETQMAFRRSGNSYYSTFEQQSDYYGFNNSGSSFAPSVSMHAQLLADVLPELTPEQKTDWDQHVLKHWALLANPLQQALGRVATRHRSRDKNEALANLYETALHSTARLKYGLSDPPTEEECRRLLTHWVKESIDHNVFRFDYSSGCVMTDGDLLLPADIHQSMRKPLMEQWKKDKYRNTSGWAPVAYYSWLDKSPDYFADFARYSATTNKARLELLDNEAPATAPLFRTLLYRRDLHKSFYPQIDLYPGQINTYSSVSNPLVEAAMREYIEKALSDPKHNSSSRVHVEQAVFSAILRRMYRRDMDQDDLAAWVSSLPLTASRKNLAMRILRTYRDNESLTFADRLQQAAGTQMLVETDLTLDDVVKWFTENPEGTLGQFLDEQNDNIAVSEVSDRRNNDESFFSRLVILNRGYNDRDDWRGLDECFVRALLKSDTPEGDPRVRELFAKLWKSSYSIESAIVNEYGEGVGTYWHDDEYVFSAGSVYLPEYILDLYLDDDNFAPRISWYSGSGIDSLPRLTNTLLPLCDSPKAGEILEKWLDEPDFQEMGSATMRRTVERSLEIWRTRNALRQRKMEVFRDLAAGRMAPDDLLLPQPPWVWRDGQYVQKEK